MDYKDLYIKLKNAYTEENLNRISTKIIDLYKRREYDAIRGLMQKIRRIISFNEKRINKIFSRLIMLYHPDKLNYYKNEIEKYYKAGKLELLFQFSHILFIIEDEKYLSEEEIINFENIVSDDIYWGFNDEDLVFIDDIESNITDQGKGSLHREYEYSDFDFFSALKRKEFGNLDVDFQILAILNIFDRGFSG